MTFEPCLDIRDAAVSLCRVALHRVLPQVGRIQREAELRVSIANAKVNHALQKSFALQKSTALQMSSLETGSQHAVGGGDALSDAGDVKDKRETRGRRGGDALSDASEKSTSSGKSTSTPARQRASRGMSPQRKRKSGSERKSGSRSSLLERQKGASKVDAGKMTESANKGGREGTLQALLLQVGAARGWTSTPRGDRKEFDQYQCAQRENTSLPHAVQRDWYFTAEQPAPAPHLAHSERCASLRVVLVAVPRVSRSCEYFPDGFGLPRITPFFTETTGCPLFPMP